MKPWNKVKQLIFKGDSGYYRTPLSQKIVVNLEQKREMGTNPGWGGAIRIEEPETPGQVPMEKTYDPVTGAEMMNPTDPSGQNHPLLRNLAYKHPTNPALSEIHGVFTSSPKPINGIHPEMISNYTFEGKAKPQFFYRFPTPKLIETAHIEDCPIVDLTPEHLQAFLKTLHRKNKNDE